MPGLLSDLEGLDFALTMARGVPDGFAAQVLLDFEAADRELIAVLREEVTGDDGGRVAEAIERARVACLKAAKVLQRYPAAALQGGGSAASAAPGVAADQGVEPMRDAAPAQPEGPSASSRAV